MSADDDKGSANPIYWLIASVIATIGLVFFPLNELAYLCFGQETQANVVNAVEYKSRRSRGFDITYSYKDSSGKERTDTDSWTRTEAPQVGGQTKIEYRNFPYPSSRRGGVDWIGLVLFTIAASAAGFLGFIIIRQLREFREQEREREERRKRKKKLRQES